MEKRYVSFNKIYHLLHTNYKTPSNSIYQKNVFLGGPDRGVDDHLTLSNLADRSEANVRGVKRFSKSPSKSPRGKISKSPSKSPRVRQYSYDCDDIECKKMQSLISRFIKDQDCCELKLKLKMLLKE